VFRACIFALIFCISCVSPPKAIEDPSKLALLAGQSTILLGSDCQRPLALGYDSCQLKESDQTPVLHLHFMNPAEYAISDCRYGIFKTGSVDKAGDVEIDLTPIRGQIDFIHFCLLRIEAVERYPDPNDKTQMRQIPFAGGFFIELLEDNYFPEPAPEISSWCYKISSTNKGRRKMERCP